MRRPFLCPHNPVEDSAGGTLANFARLAHPSAMTTAPDMATDQPGLRPSGLTAMLVLVVLSTPLFALVTFQADFTMTTMRTFSLPLVAVELIAVAIAWATGFRFWRTVAALPRSVRLGLLTWFLAALLSTALAPYPGIAAAWLAPLLVQIAFCVALYERLSGPWSGWQKSVLYAFATSLLLFVTVVHILALTVWNDPGFNWTNIGAGAIQVRHLGFFGIALAGLGLGVLASGPPRRERLFAHAMWMAGAYFVVWAGGRNPTLVMIVALALAAWVARRPLRRRLILSCLALGLSAASLTLVTAPPSDNYGLASILRRSDLSAETGNASLFARQYLWRKAAAAIVERPLVGYGEGNFHPYIAPETNNMHPHNLVLWLLVIWGLFGFAALSWLGFLALRRLPRWLRENREVSLPALGCVTCLVLVSFGDGPFVFGFAQMALAVCVAVLCSLPKVNPSEPPDPNIFGEVR